jgi:outer membrane protein
MNTQLTRCVTNSHLANYPAFMAVVLSVTTPLLSAEPISGRSLRAASTSTVEHLQAKPLLILLPPVEGPSTDPGSAWWQPLVLQRQRSANKALPVSLDSLLFAALRQSAQIQVISDLPQIGKTAIAETAAAFDWTSFIESRWDDISEPVGNVLTTGGPPRFRDHKFSNSVGFRRRNTLGAEFDISQRLGFENSNSRFFLPNDQGTARLTLSYTQPLLRRAGHVYNTSLIVLAEHDLRIAEDEFTRKLQGILFELTRTYWNLYLNRAALLQERRLAGRASEILDELESRREIDVRQSDFLRARAAVEARQAAIVRSELDVRVTEARIRSLVNDPLLGETENVELLPQDRLPTHQVVCDLPQSLSIALTRRPEMDQALQRIKAASVRMRMSENELLPVLNLVLESYISGLEGESDIGQAWQDQFSVGEPSYAVGLQYEIPIQRRAAKARYQRRRIELRNLQSQFRVTVETLKLEVEVAVYEVTAAYHEMLAQHRAMEAAVAEVDYITQLWYRLPLNQSTPGTILQDLLNAQVRLAAAEFGFLRAHVAYNLAQVNHKMAIGLLLQCDQAAASNAPAGNPKTPPPELFPAPAGPKNVF